MGHRMLIDPITRVEGHAELDIFTDDSGKGGEVRFSVKSFRGFEKFLEGSPIELLPPLTARVCGICYTAHLLASCKAIEDALGIEITVEARKFRELLHLGNFIESHALSLSALSLPDILLYEGKPEERNIVFLFNNRQDLLRRALKLRQAGSLITKIAGRRPVHPVSIVIGGILQPLKPEDRDEIATAMKGAKETILELWHLLWDAFQCNEELVKLGALESSFLSIKGSNGVELYDGDLALADKDGRIIKEFSASHYLDVITEEERPFSYMKFPVHKDGVKFRVGPLARLNISKKFATPVAQSLFSLMTSAYTMPFQSSMLYHLSRAAEAMYAVERAEELLLDEDLLSDRVMPGVYRSREARGVGIVEAPRGTLVHIYDITAEGYAQKIDLYVATQHNNFAINDALTETAKKMHLGPSAQETTLNKLEMIVRAYDPCFSCATHAFGQRELRVHLYDRDGSLIRRWE